MSQSTKRSLRTRKTPAYLLPDVSQDQKQNEDQDPINYSRQMYQREIISPAQQLNNSAKLLSKFINSANKHLRQTSKTSDLSKANEQKISLTLQKHQNQLKMVNDIVNKKANFKEGAKQETKQTKNLLSNKSQASQQYLNKSLNTDSQKPNKIPSKYKIQNNNAITKVTNKEGSKKSSIEQYQTMNIKQTLMKQAYLQQQRMLLENLPGLRNKIEISQQSQRKNNMPAHIKIFGRSAYHIGIAYHIHIKQLERKKVNMNDLKAVDPTYFARKLRQDFLEPARVSNETTF